MNIRSIFYNDEPRLRAGWRLLLQTVLLTFITFCAFLPVAFAPRFASTAELLYLQIAAFFGTTLSILLTRRFIDKTDTQPRCIQPFDSQETECSG